MSTAEPSLWSPTGLFWRSHFDYAAVPEMRAAPGAARPATLCVGVGGADTIINTIRLIYLLFYKRKRLKGYTI
jgi:hypothetical protein